MNTILGLILLVVGGVVYFQPMQWLIESWRVNPYYKHGFVVVFVSIVITAVKIVRSKTISGTNHRWIYFLAASIGLYLIGFTTGLNYVKTVPIFFTLLSVAYLLGSHIPVPDLRFPLLFPIIAIPIPFLPELTAFLQFTMVHLSTGLLRTFGFEIVSEGATIYLPNATFMIGEPSSGIQSLIALLTLMVLAIYFTKTSTRKKVFLCLFTIPVAILGNLLRIVTLLIVGHYYGEETAVAFWHDTGNILFFVVSLILLSILWCLVVHGFERQSTKRA